MRCIFDYWKQFSCRECTGFSIVPAPRGRGVGAATLGGLYCRPGPIWEVPLRPVFGHFDQAWSTETHGNETRSPVARKATHKGARLLCPARRGGSWPGGFSSDRIFKKSIESGPDQLALSAGWFELQFPCGVHIHIRRGDGCRSSGRQQKKPRHNASTNAVGLSRTPDDSLLFRAQVMCALFGVACRSRYPQSAEASS